jgi:sec-independent protein translocase protein TatB
MLGLSMTEIVIILGLALLLLGPDQLPSIAKTLGKGMREIRKATDDLKSTFDQEMVRLDTETEPQRMLQPVSTDPAAARAEARSAAAAPADPASARAAARRAAAGIPPADSTEPASASESAPQLRLVPPEGVVAREAAKLEATTGLEPPATAESTPATSAPAEAVKDAK